jgi:YggT family protein
MLALFVRFVARWLGVSASAPAIRLTAALTDWILVPIRRVVPPVGIIDASPIVAYFLLMLLRGLVLSVFFPG